MGNPAGIIPEPTESPSAHGRGNLDHSTADPPPAPLGIRAQLGALKGAVMRLVGAHVELARAEAGEIMGAVTQVAILAGIAFGALLVMGFLLPIGLFLFLGDWLFGSLGWGVLHGTLLLVALAVNVVLVALGVPGRAVTAAWLSAVALGIVTAVLLAALGAGTQLAAALGVTGGLLAWPVISAIVVVRRGIQVDKLKARFWPSGTIETTKETIEWVRAQTPLGPKS